MEFRNFLAARGHQAAIAAAVTFLAAIVIRSAAGGDSDRDALVVRLAAANAVIVSNPPPALSRPDWSALRAAWSTSSLVAPAGNRSFVAGLRPRVVASSRNGVALPTPKLKILRAPPAPSAEAAPGRISIAWKLSVPGREDAAITEIRVWRRGAGSANDIRVAVLKPGATSWDDPDVRARASYEYRIQFVTTDSTASGRNESDLSPAAVAACPAGVEIRFSGGSPEAAIIVVRKWTGGEWTEETFPVRPRDEAPGFDGAIGGQVVRTGKRFDFSTGYILTSVERATRRYKIPHEARHFVNGVPVVVKTLREMSKESLRIEFLDDQGTPGRMWKEGDLPPGAEPVGAEDR